MKVISEISEDKVYYEFLSTEWYKSHFQPFRDQGISLDALNPENDHIRIRNLLWSSRGVILDKLPRDVAWHVGELEGDDFENLFVIREKGWVDSFSPHRKVKDVASVIDSAQDLGGVNFSHIYSIKENITRYDFKERLILVSENAIGPFTIIEGNHRAVAFQMMVNEGGDMSHLPKEVIIAISPSMGSCTWL